MNKKYFNYLFKNKISLSLLLLLINVLEYTISLLWMTRLLAVDALTMKSSALGYTTHLNNVTLCLFVESTILAVYYSSIFKKKNRCDMLYSIPCKKSEITITRFLFGLFQIICTMSIAYLLGFAVGSLKFANVRVYTTFYLMIILMTVAYYIIIYFACTCANSVLDAIIFSILLVVGFILSGTIVDAFLAKIFNVSYTPNPFPLFLSTYFTQHFNSILLGVEVINPLSFHFWIRFAVVIVIAILMFFGIYSNTEKEKAEVLGTINEKFFGYKLLAPFAFSMLFSISIMVEIELGQKNLFNKYSLECLILFSIVFLIIVFIGQRKIKLKKWMLFSYLFGIMVSVIITIGYYMLFFANV